jgi:hypothetical protein
MSPQLALSRPPWTMLDMIGDITDPWNAYLAY